MPDMFVKSCASESSDSTAPLVVQKVPEHAREQLHTDMPATEMLVLNSTASKPPAVEQFLPWQVIITFRAEEFENDNRTEVPKKEKPPLTLHLQFLPLH